MVNNNFVETPKAVEAIETATTGKPNWLGIVVGGGIFAAGVVAKTIGDKLQPIKKIRNKVSAKKLEAVVDEVAEASEVAETEK